MATNSLLIPDTTIEKPLFHRGVPSWILNGIKNSWRSLAIPLVLFITIPIIAIFLKVPVNKLFDTINKTQLLQAINLSVLTSLSTTAITLLFGTPVALLLSHRNFRLHRLIDTIIDLPTVLPPSVAGIALLMAFGRRGLFGAFLSSMDITIPFTVIAVIMAQTFVASPLYIKAATIGFSSVDTELKQASALDGATRWQTFKYITLPLSWTSILSGSVMTWARALGEFGATIIFAGNFPGRTQTMPLAIYIGFEIDLNVALTLAIILICFSFLTLIIVKSLLHKRLDGESSPSFDNSL
ncbi:MAG: molybdate ABC transporter permease subunit [Chloroflexi bacterium HGW-Chloroflexi-4]|nr:MAG: molybdate ABC transporter permease subunit [Chloroflexi bacterium HGW-Chloroflexi-4]